MHSDVRESSVNTAGEGNGAARSLVVFMIEGHRYALPISLVERVLPAVEVSPLPDAPAVTLGVINVHGALIPVFDLRPRLNYPSREYGMNSLLLVASTTKRRLAVPVDEVVGICDVSAAAITAPSTILPGVDQVAGLVTLPDGLLLIYDVEALLSLDEERQLTEALTRRE